MLSFWVEDWWRGFENETVTKVCPGAIEKGYRGTFDMLLLSFAEMGCRFRVLEGKPILKHFGVRLQLLYFKL